MKRLFDVISSLIVLSIGFPFFLIIGLIIALTSKGGMFYKQVRVGKNNKNFNLLKFRSMAVGSDKKGQLTVGTNDARITKIGAFIRKFKIDEFPQLINVLKGEMSIIGPRPEVRKYVELYNEEQLRVLSVKPGLSDYASIEYINENEILGNAEDPEKTYIEEVMPAKLELNLKYINDQSFGTDMKLIFGTIFKIFK